MIFFYPDTMCFRDLILNYPFPLQHTLSLYTNLSASFLAFLRFFYRICSSIPLFPLFSPIFLDNIPICNYFENDYNRYNVHVYWTDMFFNIILTLEIIVLL